MPAEKDAEPPYFLRLFISPMLFLYFRLRVPLTPRLLYLISFFLLSFLPLHYVSPRRYTTIHAHTSLQDNHNIMRHALRQPFSALIFFRYFATPSF